MNARLRMLVVIASYGEKNLELLRRIIAGYKRMSADIDFVVVSEAGKDLGPDVEVVVGLPAKDPWSLPFAHKSIMARKADDYDLFAYSEDDMVVTEENIQAFLRVTPWLADDEIAGFLRYEVDSSENRSMPDVHSSFRWDPGTAVRRGPLVVAEFTNEHAGFYLLTCDQLRRAIASGGFMSAPHRRGRYGTPETAATDIYTACGFRKVVCVSEWEKFLIHHASNRYAGSWGVSCEAFQEQIDALLEIADGVRPAKALGAVEPNVLHRWSKSFYEKPDQEWMRAVPENVRSLLSIGCGWGKFEEELQKRGVVVTALALDSVIGAVAERRGLKVICESLEDGMQKVRSRQFDCIVMTNLLHLIEDPTTLIENCSRLLRPGGRLLLAGPNFDRIPVLVKRIFFNGDYRKLRIFAESRMKLWGPASISKMLGKGGLRIASVQWLNHSAVLGRNGTPGLRLGAMTAKDWMLTAEHA